MDFLILLFAVWWVVAFLTYTVMLKRFLTRDDIRRPRDPDILDAFGPFIGLFLLVFAIVIMNPVRWAQLVVKALGWPVTAYLFLSRRAAGRSPAEEPASEVDTDPPTAPIPVVGAVSAPAAVAAPDASWQVQTHKAMTRPAPVARATVAPQLAAGRHARPGL